MLGTKFGSSPDTAQVATAGAELAQTGAVGTGAIGAAGGLLLAGGTLLTAVARRRTALDR